MGKHIGMGRASTSENVEEGSSISIVSTQPMLQSMVVSTIRRCDVAPARSFKL